MHLRNNLSGFVLAFFLSAFPLCAAESNFEWQSVPPELAGLDSVRLAKMVDFHSRHNTTGLLVIHHDRIALEWYAPGHGPDKPHYTASLAKALVGGMSLLVALSDNLVGPDDLVCHYIPYWQEDPLRSKITVRMLATHSSGIENAETVIMGTELGHFEQTGWKLRFWNQDPEPFSMASRQAPVIFEPGHKYHYSNPGIGLLSNVVTTATKTDVRSLLKERIMDPIGAPPESYSLGYGKTFEVDGLKLVPNWGGGNYTARTVARVGRLLLRRGNWEGRQLVDSTWAHSVVQYAGTPLPDRSDAPVPAVTLGFYTNYDGVWEHVPRDAFAGGGAGQQILIVIPSLDMIIVRNGELMDPITGTFWGDVEKYICNPLMEAVIAPPLERSGLIDSISFEPEGGIAIAALDCDNWPITWADDGAMYTAWGDGWGFSHEIEKKLSNGIARIDGGPEDWTGTDIRTESGETVGQGVEGSKASGMLCVDGVLYMLIRNTGISQLSWSTDHGLTWEWGFKFDQGFGCPAFLNFCQNYAGARDNYVYIYSQDGPSAYEDYDRVILARVPKDRITEREAHEFLCGYASGGEPLWSGDISLRAGTLSFPGHCHRLDVTYNPGIKRYLMVMASNHSGALGIYEAPEPWGPWRTAFFTPYWGLGDTHGYRIPSKWISENGREFYLIFSGRPFGAKTYDAFCVRKATIHLAGE